MFKISNEPSKLFEYHISFKEGERTSKYTRSKREALYNKRQGRPVAVELLDPKGNYTFKKFANKNYT